MKRYHENTPTIQQPIRPHDADHKLGNTGLVHASATVLHPGASTSAVRIDTSILHVATYTLHLEPGADYTGLTATIRFNGENMATLNAANWAQYADETAPVYDLTTTTEYFDTVGATPWVVPDGVWQIDATCWGGRSDSGIRVQRLDVTPGETIYLYVGGAPTPSGPGFNGGGVGEYVDTVDGVQFTAAGAGATDIRRGGFAAVDRIIVGGGFGGTPIERTPFGLAIVDGALTDLVEAGNTSISEIGATAIGPFTEEQQIGEFDEPYEITLWPGAGGGGYIGGTGGDFYSEVTPGGHRYRGRLGIFGSSYPSGMGETNNVPLPSPYDDDYHFLTSDGLIKLTYPNSRPAEIDPTAVTVVLGDVLIDRGIGTVSMALTGGDTAVNVNAEVVILG